MTATGSSAFDRVKARMKHMSPRRRRDYLTFVAFIAPNLILFGVFTFWPFVYSFVLSLTKWNMIGTARFVKLDNYDKIWNDPIFWLVLKNTVLLAIGVVVIKLVLAMALAIVLNQRLAGRSVYRAIIFSPTFTTSVAVAMVWTWIFDPFYGLLRVPLSWVGVQSPAWLSDVNWSLPAVIIVSIWSGLGYDMVIFLAGMQGISREYYEAARVDGASSWQLFKGITFPLLSPTTFFLTITSIISAFRTFDIVSVMTGGGPLNSSNVYIHYIYQNAFRWFKMGYASAMAVIF
ncbi:MAG: sugar ABC transporter permease, partial [Anaerolineae bacterium]|nr:sugar ABC transporter permease [Anaerolineae bacterium]